MPSSTSCAVPKGKASLSSGCSQIGWSRSRAFGPMTESTASPALTSSTVQCAPSGTWRLIHVRSRTSVAPAVTTRNEVAPSRVTVTSASMPPRAFRNCV